MPGSNGYGMAPEGGGGGYTKPSTSSSSSGSSQESLAWQNKPEYMKQYDKTATVTETSGGKTTVKNVDMAGLGSSAMNYANAEGDAISDTEKYLNTPQYMKEYYASPEDSEEPVSADSSEATEGESNQEGETEETQQDTQDAGTDEEFDYYPEKAKYSSNILSSGHGNTVGNHGFYYDTELNDPFLSITLHPNTVPKDSGEGGVKDDKGDGWEIAPGPYLKPTTQERDGEPYYDRYSVTPIARAIMTEEFSMSVHNEWYNFSGSNPIETAYNNFRPYSPILRKFGDNWQKGIEEVSEEGGFGSEIVNFLNKNIAGPAAKVIKTIGEFQNNAIVVQGMKYTYYEGTTFNFNNMTLKFLKLSDWEIKNGTPVFVPVTEYIKTLNPYVMGKYHKSIADDQKLTGSETIDNLARDLLGYQSPPGGFQMDNVNLGNILRGTLRLIIGGKYTIPNLVLANMDLVYSKAQAKDPRPEMAGKTVPLYAEITLTLKPASMFTDGDYEKFTGIYGEGGYGSAISRVEEKYGQQLEEMRKVAMTSLKGQ